MREIVFWFGYNSPYSMLAHHRIEDAVAGLDVSIRYRAWFAGVTLPDYKSAKVQYVVEDVIRYARAYGLHLRPGAYVDPSAACRGFLLARESGVARAYNEGVHLARWRNGLDISQPDVLSRVAAGCGLEPRAFEEALKGGRFIEEMKREQADAIAAGVFGVPFFEFEGHRFWGNDRLEWLLAAARGEAPEQYCSAP